MVFMANMVHEDLSKQLPFAYGDDDNDDEFDNNNDDDNDYDLDIVWFKSGQYQS